MTAAEGGTFCWHGESALLPGDKVQRFAKLSVSAGGLTIEPQDSAVREPASFGERKADLATDNSMRKVRR
ncbi:hypothetical protein [Streptomyces sp. NPDC050264]|uniref:hypothetical protein n=1 Tax=Streptomyces sp. NPDC050264 TaxID=3155038 RepID=UPI0034432D9A